MVSELSSLNISIFGHSSSRHISITPFSISSHLYGCLISTFPSTFELFVLHFSFILLLSYATLHSVNPPKSPRHPPLMPKQWPPLMPKHCWLIFSPAHPSRHSLFPTLTLFPHIPFFAHSPRILPHIYKLPSLSLSLSNSSSPSSCCASSSPHPSHPLL